MYLTAQTYLNIVTYISAILLPPLAVSLYVSRESAQAALLLEKKFLPGEASNDRAARWNQPCVTATDSISKQEISVHARKHS